MTGANACARLLEAFDPLARATMATLPADEAERLCVYVRPFPVPGETPGMRVWLLVEPTSRKAAGDVLCGGLVADMSNRADVEVAVENVLFVTLAALGTSGAADAMRAQATRKAVLLVEAQPVLGSVKVVAVPRKGRAKPRVLGTLTVSPSAVAH